MAIPGKETITVGVENQATGSDDLYTAFRKVVTNFNTLFNSASPYTDIVNGSGISTFASANSLTITNTGVTKLTAGTGITLNNSTGNVIISVSGSNSGTVAGVTNVNVTSSTLSVTGSPIISQGNISVDLPVFATTANFAPGEYVSPTLTVDQYGRITKIAPISTAGTVTSIAVTANGVGLAITGSPITSSGTIQIKNTGVTKLNAGPGIRLSGDTGEITVSSFNSTYGTVTRLDITSTTLVVSGSPITSTGTISVELPSTVTFSTKMTSANVVSTGPMSATGNLSGGNISTVGKLDVTGNATIGNVTATSFTGDLLGNVNGKLGETTRNTGKFTTVDATGTISSSGNVSGANLVASSLVKSVSANIGNVIVTGNVTVGKNITASVGDIDASSGNVTAGNIVYGAGYVYARNFLYTPGHLVIGTGLPTANLFNGTIAIDQANNRLAVIYGGTWHYVTLNPY